MSEKIATPELTDLDRAEQRADRAHVRTMELARQIGSAKGVASGIESVVKGLLEYVTHPDIQDVALKYSLEYFVEDLTRIQEYAARIRQD